LPFGDATIVPLRAGETIAWSLAWSQTFNSSTKIVRLR
jgi:hypothetical protein